MTPEQIAARLDEIDRDLSKRSGHVTTTEGRCLAQLIAQLARIVAQNGAEP